MKVLVVDDDEPIRTIVAETLAEIPGCTVAVAASGKEALEICRTHGDVEIILTDLEMNGMSGIELAKEVSSLANPPVVVLMTASRVARKGAEMNISAILQKPFLAGDLLDAIQAARAAHATFS
jgi:CheY-like chemotaxis protein